MDFVCDAPGGKTWFQLTSEAEAIAESSLMGHAVEKHFRQFGEQAAASYAPSMSLPYIERDIGLKDHVRRMMPLFLTLRDGEGGGLATAMLPSPDPHGGRVRPIVVGVANTDPWPEHGSAIKALAAHFKIPLDSAVCYPYRRG